MRIGNTIYLDHHATTPVDSRVLKGMIPYFDNVFGNPHSTDHAMGWTAAQAVEEAAAKVATLIGADPDEIIFTSGATEANNLALLGMARRAVVGKRRRILCSAIEHKSVLAVSRVLEEQLGFQVERLQVDQIGRISIADLERTLSDDVLIVSIVAVNNEIGTIQNIREIASKCDAVGAVFHCDSAQAPCAIDMRTIGQSVHMLSLSAHKMYGPKGVGVLFARRNLHERIEPIIYGGGQQKNLRSGTLPATLCVGMGLAAELLTDSALERETIQRRRDRFLDLLRRLQWSIGLNGPEASERHPGNASVCFEGFSAHDLLGALQPRLAASTGSACTSGIPEPSHVLRAIGLSDEDASASIRFSIGRFTTDGDIEEAVSLIDEALMRLSGG